ncbi:MAG: TetR-like C-terminal domain-containing protein [Acetobacter syzygii]|uniref:TetR-like C-terminal domain-containing protein n=2 Tax=Acetobacter syzygii TaxID=146476 RepID=UPI0039ED6FE6
MAQRNLRVDCPLKPSGRLSEDLPAWAEMYQEEMDSTPGRAMIRDVLRGWDGTQKACPLLDAVRPSIALICEAAGESVTFDVEAVIDAVVAPLVTRIVFTDAPLPPRWRATRRSPSSHSIPWADSNDPSIRR